MLFLYYFVQFTWGIPQSILGAFLFLLCALRGGRRSRCRGAFVISWKKRSSASIGPFLFLSESLTGDQYDRVLAHEYGHSIQSLILGPLYLAAVGIPSAAWCNLPFFIRLRRRKHISYYAVYPENWADRLGGVSGRIENKRGETF